MMKDILKTLGGFAQNLDYPNRLLTPNALPKINRHRNNRHTNALWQQRHCTSARHVEAAH